MNNQISQLHETARKSSRMILGVMSGTSMDGLDLALCRVEGSGPQTSIELLEFATQTYPAEMQRLLRRVVSVQECRLEDMCVLNTHLGDHIAEGILHALSAWGRMPEEIDCVASHGQTIYHAPKSKHGQAGLPDATLQVADGDHIAWRTGIMTLSDFRQKHTAAGGEGAPMAALIDRTLFGHARKDRLLLNIGGIANFTYVPATSSQRTSVTADTGPGNTLMNAAAVRLLDRPYDDGGETARSGKVNEALLQALKAEPYFDLELTGKTTGPERFDWDYVQRAKEKAGAADVSTPNLLATLTKLTADTIADAVHRIDSDDRVELLVSGGGIHNHYLMELLREQLKEASFGSFAEEFFNPDAKEAVCFAVLANESLSGEGFYVNPGEQNRKVNFGKISLPS